MKKFLGFLSLVLILPAAPALAGVFEDWANILVDHNTAAYTDEYGSKIDIGMDDGPGGSKALKLTADLVQGGHGGIWRNLSVDLSKSTALRFQIKTSVLGEMRMTLKDAFNVQYVADFQIPTQGGTYSWEEVTLLLSSFNKDPDYTPPDAIPGHPPDFSNITRMKFEPKITGPVVIEVGPVEADGSAVPLTAGNAPVTAGGK